MTEIQHVGFTGTRLGCTSDQWVGVDRVLREVTGTRAFVAHHGDCVGADAEFHDICLTIGRVTIEIHPGPISDLSAGCRGHVRHPVEPHMKRNAKIVAVSHIMIGAPPTDEPQERGGTWATIRMAIRAMRNNTLRRLYVVGRGGQLLAWQDWRRASE